MKMRTILIAVFLTAFSGMVAAGEAHTIMRASDTVELLSEATGLTIGEVELALGPSAHYEQSARYESATRRFRQAVGRTMYEQIMGEGELNARQVQDLTAMARARQARLAAGH